MKKYLVALIVNTITITSFAQIIHKEYPYKDKKDRDHYYYCTSYPVGDKKILSIFAFKEMISLKLFDNELNLIGEKKMERETQGPYDANFYLTKNNLFVIEKEVVRQVFLDENLKSKTISMPTLPKPRSGSNFPESKKPQFHIDNQEQNYYYGVDEENVYFKGVNFETKKSKKFTTNLKEKEKVTVSEFATFNNNNMVAVTRIKKTKEGKLFEIALHDELGKELSVINRLENGFLKETVNYANIDNEVYVVGNYKEKTSVNEAYFIVASINNNNNKPKFEGIYVHSMNSDKALNKYYKYSDFNKLISQMAIDEKKPNDIENYRFQLQNVISNNNEKIVIGTLDKDNYEYYTGSQGNSKLHMGQELTYILIFGINNEGDLLWNQVISLDWIGHPKYKVTGSSHIVQVDNFDQKFVAVEKKDNKIKCHYSFKDNISSFEIDNGQIVNMKQTHIELKPSHDNKSVYWYDNFYFNHNGLNGLEFDKIEFNR